MARFRGPKSKISRRFKEAIFGPDKALGAPSLWTRPARQHPPPEERIRVLCAAWLKSKRQSTPTASWRSSSPTCLSKPMLDQGITGEILLQFCESRLDNVVFRLGIGELASRGASVGTHRHIMVNGHLVNIPSYRLRPGDVVAVREKSKSIGRPSRALWALLQSGWSGWIGMFRTCPEHSSVSHRVTRSLRTSRNRSSSNCTRSKPNPSSKWLFSISRNQTRSSCWTRLSSTADLNSVRSSPDLALL